MGSGFRIGRLFGINVRVDWSWLLIFFLITSNLRFAFSQMHGDWSAAVQWLVAVTASLLFFVSVLAHEFAHSLVAQARGTKVNDITLFLFGGVSNIQREPSSAADEFWITIVGPLMSLAIGIVLLLATGLSVNAFTNLNSPEQLSQLNPAFTIVAWLGSVNIILAVFNMIPGFPLDGGRILRSILWAVTDNLRQATRWASYVGQGVGALFIALGIASFFGVNVPFFGAGFVNGLWLIFIGWFLNTAAAQSYQRVVIRDILGDVPVSKIMRKNPHTISPTLTINQLVDDHLMQYDDHAFPVVDGEKLVGLVCLHDVRGSDKTTWGTKAVRDIMTPYDQLITVAPDEDASDALNKLMQKGVRQLPVETDQKLEGLLRRQDIMRWLEIHADEGQSTPPQFTQQAGASSS